MYSNADEIIASANKIFSNSIGDELIIIFGNRYFGKTKLITQIQNSLQNQKEYYVINPQIHYAQQLQDVASTIMKCYIIAISQTLDSLCEQKSLNSIRKFINILKLNKKMVNLLFSFSSSRHDKLISKLIHFSLDDLRSILNTISSSKPYAFLIAYCELDQEDINHLCVMHTKYSRNSVNMAKIDYAIGIRPYKGSYSLIEKLQMQFAPFVHYFSLLPDFMQVENSNTPYEVNNLILTECEFSTEITLTEEYIHHISSLPEYAPVVCAHDAICNQSMALYAQLSAFNESYLKQIDAIITLCNKFQRERSINKKEFLNSSIVWFLNGKYTIVDAWSYYVFFRKNRSELVLDSQNLFFSLYNVILHEQLDHSQLMELIYLINELKSGECRNILSLGYSDYYHYLCDWLKWLIKKSLKTKIAGNNLSLFSDFCIHSIYEFSKYLLKYSETLFERVQRLDLIDITLEKIEQHLKCFSIIEEYRFDEYYIKNIFYYLKFSLEIGNKWCDITIIEKVLQICELIVKKDVQLNYLSKVFYDDENNMLCKFSFTNSFETILEQYNYVYKFYQDEKKREEKLRMENVKIGIITALPKEFAAMEVLLDNCNKHPFEGKGAGHQYLVGEILSYNGGAHQIALGMCGMGNNQAAIRATNMINHFPNIDVIFMTGIAGGIPDNRNIDEHVRLGDIVVSEGIVQYDFIKDTPDGVICRSAPPKPSAKVIEAVNLLRKDEYFGKRKWEDYIDEIVNKYNKFKKPSLDTDILHDEIDNIIDHPYDIDRTNYPKVFLGKIGSANTLLKNPKTRAYLKKEHGVYAVEMEASGIADATWNNALGYIAIRGICDYGDTHKSNLWQEYAAAVAAAYTRSVIEALTY